MNPRRLAPVFLSLLAAAPQVFGQGTPITGTAALHASATSSPIAINASFQVNVSVDLTNVKGSGPSGVTSAVLGGYQIAVSYDQSKVQFTSANGGSSSGFTSAPVFTNPATANTNGQVVITAAQSGSSAPTGLVSVASLMFTANAVGTVSLPITATSLSSAFQPPSFGPASIPSTGTSVSVTIIKVPAAPTQLSPTDNATVSAPVTLSWTGNSDATSYNVFFGTTLPLPLFASTTGTSVSVPTKPGTAYLWSVTAVNAVGSGGSSTLHFRTSGTPPCVAPSVPTLSSAASPVPSGSPIQLSWTVSATATEYRVDESTNSAFTAPATVTVTAPASSTAFTHTVSQDTTFYYRVTAAITGTCNVTSAVSNTVSVVVSAPPVFLRTIAVAGSTAGANNSFFRTATQFFNPESAALTGTITFHPAGQSASASDPSMPYSVLPGQTVAYPDIVNAMHVSGLGSIDLTTAQTAFPVAFIRVYNDGGALGTTGLAEDLLRPEDALQTGDMTVLFGPQDPVGTRVNIGLRTLGMGATINVIWRSESGAEIKTLTKSFPPNYFVQISDATFLESSSSLSANDNITISVTSGSLFFYEALTDNKTQDPTMEIGRRIN